MHSHTYPPEGQAEEVREGFDPDQPQPHNPEQIHNLDYPFTVEEGEVDQNDDRAPPVSEEAQHWESRDYGEGHDQNRRTSPQYGSFREEHNAWNDS